MSRDLQLRYFLVLAEEQSLTRSAARIGVSQPALSQQMRQLEEALGHSLFRRHGRGISLTRAGEELHQSTRAHYAAVDRAVVDLQENHGRTSGTIGIASVQTLGACFLPRIIPEFGERFPGARLVVFSRPASAVVDLVRFGKADIGFVYGHVPADADIRSEHLFFEEMILACPPSLPDLDRIRRERRLNADVPLVAFPRGYALRDLLDRVIRVRARQIQVEVETLDALMAIAGTGVGACLLPASIPDVTLAFYNLERITLAHPHQLTREVALISRASDERSMLVEGLVAEAKRQADAVSRHMRGRDSARALA